MQFLKVKTHDGLTYLIDWSNVAYIAETSEGNTNIHFKAPKDFVTIKKKIESVERILSSYTQGLLTPIS